MSVTTALASIASMRSFLSKLKSSRLKVRPRAFKLSTTTAGRLMVRHPVWHDIAVEHSEVPFPQAAKRWTSGGRICAAQSDSSV